MLNDFSTSEEFHERWKAKTRQVMTDFEWRKRRLGIRLKEEEERISKGEKEAMAEMREQQKAQKEWDRDDHREKRVASWRDFMHTQKTKKKKGGLKSVRCAGGPAHAARVGAASTAVSRAPVHA